MEYNEFLKTLASDASRNFKISLLSQHKNDEVLREVIRLALDPMTQFYQRKIPIYHTGDNPHSLKKALPKLAKLYNREVTGNAAIEYLRLLLTEVSAQDANVLERIIQKDLRCGVSVSTANKIWPNLVKDYPCMLCSQYEQKLVKKIKWPAYVQMKMDGMRFNAIVRNGGVEFRSRNGKELNLLGELEEEFLTLANGIECVFDGELMIAPRDYGFEFVDRQTGNGILNKAIKGTIRPEETKQVRVSLWDVIPWNNFVKGVCDIPYKTRWSTLEQLVSKKLSTGKRIRTVWHQEVTSLQETHEIFRNLLTEGHEGIILKDKNGKWENKRTKSQIKFKGELECDLRIVGIQEGTGKYQGMLGALLCESADGAVKVMVGSGFNDEQRSNYGSDLVGKIVAIKYNTRITNKQGEESLFLPIFMEVREDKDVADLSKDIK